MSITGVAANALDPAHRAAASATTTSLFSVPQDPSAVQDPSATTDSASLASKAASEIQALLLQLQGGDPQNPTAAGSQQTATSGSDPSVNDPSNSANSDGNVTSDGGVTAWLAQALQAYAPLAGTALGGPVGGAVGLAVSAIA